MAICSNIMLEFDEPLLAHMQGHAGTHGGDTEGVKGIPGSGAAGGLREKVRLPPSLHMSLQCCPSMCARQPYN